ncbi:MAG: flagellar hook-basal body protein [Cellulosilyticum sp.]|nr:flagellar hook-basal body protein [Cellulosilyticum sp.]
MVRALYTAASGMTAQQLNVDTISNNLANVNTVGYKKETTNFKSLLYTNLRGPENEAITETTPSVKQVGHGVRALANSRNYSTGTLQKTENPTDIAIVGNGFFAIDNNGEEVYTRDGSFRFAMLEDEGSYALVTADGYPVLSTEDESIIIGSEVSTDKLKIGEDGTVFYLDEEGIKMDVAQIKVVQFANREGLEATGGNLYKATAASGEPMVEGDDDMLTRSTLRTGYLEGSNVQLAEEMVNLIIAQRAYEVNSTAIKTADDMMQQANQLKQ